MRRFLKHLKCNPGLEEKIVIGERNNPDDEDEWYALWRFTGAVFEQKMFWIFPSDEWEVFDNEWSALYGLKKTVRMASDIASLQIDEILERNGWFWSEEKAELRKVLLNKQPLDDNGKKELERLNKEFEAVKNRNSPLSKKAGKEFHRRLREKEEKNKEKKIKSYKLEFEDSSTVTFDVTENKSRICPVTKKVVTEMFSDDGVSFTYETDATKKNMYRLRKKTK